MRGNCAVIAPSTTCKSFWTTQRPVFRNAVVLDHMSWGLTVCPSTHYPYRLFLGLCPHRRISASLKTAYIQHPVILAWRSPPAKSITGPRRNGGKNNILLAGGICPYLSEVPQMMSDKRAAVPSSDHGGYGLESVCISKPKASWLTTSNGSINVMG